LGVARGLGVEVWLPENCPMLHSDLYGFEGAQRVPLTYLAELQATEIERAKRSAEEFKELAETAPPLPFGGQPDPEHLAYYERMGQVRDMHFIHDGAVQALAQLQTDFNVQEIVNRQELERQATVIQVEKNRTLSNLNWHEGIVQDRRSRMMHNPEVEQFRVEFQEAFEKQMESRDTYFVHDGGLQVLRHLIAKCDLQPGEYIPRFHVITYNAPNDAEDVLARVAEAAGPVI